MGHAYERVNILHFFWSAVRFSGLHSTQATLKVVYNIETVFTSGGPFFENV
jgi:hypothetical protein